MDPKLLGTKGIATRNKDATRGAPGLTTRNKKLLGAKKGIAKRDVGPRKDACAPRTQWFLHVFLPKLSEPFLAASALPVVALKLANYCN